MVKKKVVRKSLTERRLDKLEGRLDKILEVLTKDPKATEEVLKEEVKKEAMPPKPKGPKMYKFHSEHAEMQQRLKMGRKSEVDPVTGDYTLIPPVFAEFGAASSGPVGFWKTDDAELAEILRDIIRRKKLEGFQIPIVEVTDDPAFAHI